jgi:hypothetical protein
LLCEKVNDGNSTDLPQPPHRHLKREEDSSSCASAVDRQSGFFPEREATTEQRHTGEIARAATTALRLPFASTT